MKSTAISIAIAGVLIAGAIVMMGDKSTTKNADTNAVANNVSVVDGKQIIEIDVNGGYKPRITTAKADMPTVLKMKTQGTFDCSSTVTIPSIGYQAYLPQSGVTNIEVPAQKSGSTLKGMCSMGMYNFSVKFI